MLCDSVARLKEYRQRPDDDGPFKLECRIAPGMSLSAIEFERAGMKLSNELIELWQLTREAWLFEDVEYGQWGGLPPVWLTGRGWGVQAACAVM